jgi:Transposase and inactivated derivatives
LSHNYSIKNLLNLKEENIYFDEKFSTKERDKNGNSYTVLHAKLAYKPKVCQCCGKENFNNSIIKHSFKSSNIALLDVCATRTVLRLRKQRFLCKHCKKTFIAKTNIVEKNCYISNDLKIRIALELKETVSIKYIAKTFNVSSSTVMRVMKNYYPNNTMNRNYLPENLCFDEFKSVKDAAGAMSFVCCNAKAPHNIIDIVENRQLRYLKEYFELYPKEVRAKVKTIIIDMYKPYIILIKELFPNAIIITDRFHTVQLISRVLNKVRISVMNAKKSKEKPIYNKLKRYWKLILKADVKCAYIPQKYSLFKDFLSEREIVEYLLSLDDDLKSTYELYQDIIYAISYKNIDGLEKAIEKKRAKRKEVTTALSTLKKYFDSISNSLKYPYSNGPVEGINNKIKVLKRVSYGFRRFKNFKKRILICFNQSILVNPIKRLLAAA